MKFLGIILSVILLIVIPTRDKWSYKVMHDRNIETGSSHEWGVISMDENPNTPHKNKRRC